MASHMVTNTCENVRWVSKTWNVWRSSHGPSALGWVQVGRISPVQRKGQKRALDMKTKLLVGAALAAVFAATGASAQITGWYAAIDGGVHFPQDMHANSPAVNTTWKLNSGWMVDGHVGYQFTPNWRLEGEVAYRDSDLHSIGSPAGGHRGGGGGGGNAGEGGGR